MTTKKERQQTNLTTVYVVTLAVLLLVGVYVLLAWSPWWYGWR